MVDIKISALTAVVTPADSDEFETNQAGTTKKETRAQIVAGVAGDLTTHEADTTAHGATGAVVGTTNTQTLTNKTIVAANNTVTTAAAGNLAATELNAALAELDGQDTTIAGDLSTHTGATGTAVHGLGTMSTQAANSVAITGGSVTGITDITVADGGTGASTASAAFDALKQAATDTATGVVEKATTAEAEAGTAADKFPDVVGVKAAITALAVPSSGTWTPVLTFATPGDLSVTYGTQFGSYMKIGDLVVVTCVISASAFTHSTASGNLLITGLPFTSENTAAQQWYGGGLWSGITKANFTDINARLQPNESQVSLRASGSGQASSEVTSADVPSGGTVIIHFTLTYKAA